MQDENEPDFSLIIASAVHDMKNSLGMLLHSVDMLCEEIPEELKQNLNTAIVQYEAERVNNYLIQLLGLYRLQNKRLSLHIDEHYLADMLEEQVAHYSQMLAGKHISLRVEVDPGLVWFFDREIILGVLNNALNNASRYTKSAIEIVAREDGKYLVIEVNDDGDGYPAALLDMDPSEITKNINFRSGSTSLGLYFAAMVTRMHKQGDLSGDIKLSNGGRLGGGQFTIYLP